MTSIDDILVSISAKMDDFLYNSSYHSRSVEPSPGDTFDVNYSPGYAERFYYINTEYILPLHSLHNGEIVEFRGHKENGHDIVSWEDIVGSIDESDYPEEVTVEVVSNKNAHRDQNESSAVNWLSQWAAKHPDTKESVLIRSLIGMIRGG